MAEVTTDECTRCVVRWPFPWLGQDIGQQDIGQQDIGQQDIGEEVGGAIFSRSPHNLLARAAHQWCAAAFAL